MFLTTTSRLHCTGRFPHVHRHLWCKTHLQFSDSSNPFASLARNLRTPPHLRVIRGRAVEPALKFQDPAPAPGILIFWLRYQHFETFGSGSGSSTIWSKKLNAVVTRDCAMKKALGMKTMALLQTKATARLSSLSKRAFLQVEVGLCLYQISAQARPSHNTCKYVRNTNHTYHVNHTGNATER